MLLTGIARLGRDAELRYTPSGHAVANLSLAYNYGMKDAEGKKPTQWVEASLWGKQAEALIDYLVKGQALSVTADDVHIEEFTRKDGTLGSKLVGKVIHIEFAGKSSDATQQQPAPEPTPKPAPKPAAKPSLYDLDDDIPF